MKENKYHDLDKQVTRQIRSDLLADGTTEYPVNCNYCDEDGRVESDKCPICGGAKQYMFAVNE